MGIHGSTPYPKELRDQAVRLVRQWRKEHDRRYGGIREVAQQLGVHVESVRNWVRQASIDSGDALGVTSEEVGRGTRSVRVPPGRPGPRLRLIGGAPTVESVIVFHVLPSLALVLGACPETEEVVRRGFFGAPRRGAERVWSTHHANFAAEPEAGRV
jgi:transposase